MRPSAYCDKLESLYTQWFSTDQLAQREVPTVQDGQELGIVYDRISKSFGDVVAVNGVNLKIPNGLLYALLGPNGSGKSTLMKLTVGTLRPDSGRVLVNGVDAMLNPISVRKNVGYMPEEVVTYDSLTPAEYLSFIASLYEMPSESVRSRSEALVHLLALDEYMTKPIGELSHGNRRKVVLAASIIHDPSVLILDEPFSGLDPESAKVLKETLLDYVSKRKTVMISTHVMEIAEAISKRVAIMQGGKVVAEGELEDLRSRTGAKDLEEAFLQVTGVSGEIQDLLTALKAL